MDDVFIDVGLACLPLALGLSVTWRLVWPRWKLMGKVVTYLGTVALLSWWIGHWSLALAYLHQSVGLAVHVWFSRKHGFTWYAVEDPDRYVRLSKEWVGHPGGIQGGRSNGQLTGKTKVPPATSGASLGRPCGDGRQSSRLSGGSQHQC